MEPTSYCKSHGRYQEDFCPICEVIDARFLQEEEEE